MNALEVERTENGEERKKERTKERKKALKQKQHKMEQTSEYQIKWAAPAM